MANVKAIPEGMHTLTPQLTVDGCDQAIEWYKLAFNAELHSRAPDPSGKKIWHAQLAIGDVALFVNDTFPEMGGGAPILGALWIYGDKVDERWQRAVSAGLQVLMPISDMFWGDRTGTLQDRWGVRWTLSQRMKNLTPAELKQAEAAFVAEMAKQGPPK